MKRVSKIIAIFGISSILYAQPIDTNISLNIQKTISAFTKKLEKLPILIEQKIKEREELAKKIKDNYILLKKYKFISKSCKSSSGFLGLKEVCINFEKLNLKDRFLNKDRQLSKKLLKVDKELQSINLSNNTIVEIIKSLETLSKLLKGLTQ